MKAPETIAVNGRAYPVLRLLGHGKGGYSYLVEANGQACVVKQIHHEPCDYYAFGDKLAAERNDYRKLLDAGIPVPRLLDVDEARERILKEYAEGPTILELLRQGGDVSDFLPRIRAMAEDARRVGLNIDYFPSNFVASEGRLIYVDYECNPYSEEWSFGNWGVRYWSRSPELLEYLSRCES